MSEIRIITPIMPPIIVGGLTETGDDLRARAQQFFVNGIENHAKEGGIIIRPTAVEYTEGSFGSQIVKPDVIVRPNH